jgi:uncharacterized membrane protein
MQHPKVKTMTGKQTAILDVVVAYLRQQRRRKLKESHFPYPGEQRP